MRNSAFNHQGSLENNKNIDLRFQEEIFSTYTKTG